MSTGWKLILWGTVLSLLGLSAWLWHLSRSAEGKVSAMKTPEAEPLRVVVTDPLSSALRGTDTGDLARRDYSVLAAYLRGRIRRSVQVSYTQHLPDVLRSQSDPVDLIIGKASAVQLQAAMANLSIRPLLRLTDREGRSDVAGLFVVRVDDLARTMKDLADYTILLGPACDEERHSAALAALANHGVTVVPPLQIVTSCTTAAMTVAEGQAGAAVISAYAEPLVDGCDGVERGTLRVIGRTAPVPFITVFATTRVAPNVERDIMDALLSVNNDPQLLGALDSKTGFVGLHTQCAVQDRSPLYPDAVPWTDWRGPDRSAITPSVPDHLPCRASLVWRRGLTGTGLSGVAATLQYVIIADKNDRKDQDIWRCLDAKTGKEIWTIAYATPTKMEFTNAPRAAPVIHDDLVYLLGAFGDLHCVDLRDSRILWRRNVVKDFGADLATWGMSSTPLIVDDKLIVNPGAQDASLVALDLSTGAVLWKTPGEPAAHASLILGIFGGVRQIVGYDARSLGGWDPNTGQRLWELLPLKKGDYNVPTPVNVAGQILLSTENNGTRLHVFGESGRILTLPAAWNPGLKPDTSTPVAVSGLVFGCSGGLFCLDLGDGLKTLYTIGDDPAFENHVTLIAGNDRVLAISVDGELILFEASRTHFTLISRLRLFRDAEIWSHPALVGDRLYVRSMTEVYCILLSDL
ncbi:MAG: PQQ-binding-like beta-propeller repeat protein [Sedimentisphaerales bacterium]|nr:PQQ-binding-like beta-propeller repeat protein [Sedimentisphaerales bacterium]